VLFSAVPAVISKRRGRDARHAERRRPQGRLLVYGAGIRRASTIPARPRRATSRPTLARLLD
jgi:hypothetical protein